MNKRFGAIAILVAAGAATTGLFASPSNSAAYCKDMCTVALTGTGPSPSAVKKFATGNLSFANTDSVTHTVVGPAFISDAFFTGMKNGKPGLRFALHGGGDNNTAEFTSFDVRLPRGHGLRFNRKGVMKGTACHGPGKWKSASISAREMRCTPRVPLPLAEAVTNIGISAIHESRFLEQEVKEHKVMTLPFYITVEDSNHNLIHTRGVGAIKSPTASSGACFKGPLCLVSITATGPSPRRVRMIAADQVLFENTGSVTHTVVFANGRCNLTLAPKSQGGSCNPNFSAFVGSYAYTVDGKFPGTVVTIPWGRSETLTARRHGIRHGTGLTLHGRVSWYNQNPATSWKGQLLVKVLARHDSGHHFEPMATVRLRARFPEGHGEDRWGRVSYGWKLKVRPGVKTTYIAKVTGGAPPHWQGQFWINAKSRPFTVRIRH
jgi:hypothetical protein